MHTSVHLPCVTLFGFLCFQQGLQITAIDSPKTKVLRNLMPIKTIASKPQFESLSYRIGQKGETTARPKRHEDVKQIERQDVLFPRTLLGLAVKSENQAKALSENLMNPYQRQYAPPKLLAPRPLVRQQNETEAERAERIHKSFERLLTFVEIVGQVDNYVSSKWKNLVKTVSNFYEEEDEPYRIRAKPIYGTCSNPH